MSDYHYQKYGKQLSQMGGAWGGTNQQQVPALNKPSKGVQPSNSIPFLPNGIKATIGELKELE